MKEEKKTESFEEALARLEKIVAEMERGDLPLDAMMKDFEEGRRLIRDSIEVSHWEPEAPAAWDDAYPRWLAAKQRASLV